MDSNEPKEGEPHQIATPERRLFKPQTLNWTPTQSTTGSTEDVASVASTPNDIYQTPSTDTAPEAFSFHESLPPGGADGQFVEPTAVPYNNLNKLHRTGGESYVLQEWSDGTPELAPGIPGIIPSKTSPSYGQMSTSRLITMAYDRGLNSDCKTTDGSSNVSKQASVREGATLLRRSPSNSRIASSGVTTKRTLPNQTTWKRSVSERNINLSNGGVVAEPAVDSVSAAGMTTPTELSDIRLKMEERRRLIEMEKRRLEIEWSKQRQVVDSKALETIMTRSSSGLATYQTPVSKYFQVLLGNQIFEIQRISSLVLNSHLVGTVPVRF